MSYTFFLDDLQLPVTPAKMSMKIKNKNKTIDLINEGEVNLIKPTGLTEISFDMRLPSDARPYANFNDSLADNVTTYIIGKLGLGNWNYKKASVYLAKVKALKESRKPFTFVAIRQSPRYASLFDTNMLVTIEDYSIEEDAGDGFDITVPIKLKQFRDYYTKEIEVKTASDGTQTVTYKPHAGITKKSLATYHKVTDQQSIWEVAQKAAGGSIDWKSILNINKNMGNPFKIPTPGTILKIPTTDTASDKNVASVGYGDMVTVRNSTSSGGESNG